MKQMLAELRVRAQKVNRPLRLMEVCGTHSVEIFRHGVRSVIPSSITLLSGARLSRVRHAHSGC